MSIEIPGYSIKNTLGKGGMATVYLAEQTIFEREVALKVMSKSLGEDPLFGQRFMREAKIVSQLVHPNIVNVHDVGMHDGHYYLAMQYVDGNDLKAIKNTLTLKDKIRAVRDIAKALDYAGGKGYVHRDIKPENILFDSSDGRAILTDFGIAKATESDLAMTQTGTAIGTPHYMSPEQAKGLEVDKRADIYSLGVVFYLLITGYLPYDAQSAVAIGIKHITEPVPLLPSQFGVIQSIIDKMMAKRVDERFQSASEVVYALDGIDMAVLEHAASMALQISATDECYDPLAETEITTAPSLSAIREGGIEFPYATDERLSDTESNFTVVYASDDDQVKRYGYLWLVGLVVLAVAGVWLFYTQYPQHVSDIAQGLSRTTDNTMTQVQRWADSATLEDEPKLRSKPIDKPTQKPEVRKPAVIAVVDLPEPVSETVQLAQQNVTELNALYESDPSRLPELSQAYIVLLASDPSDTKAAGEFQSLDTSAQSRAIDFARAGDFDMAEVMMSAVVEAFPETPEQTIIDLNVRIEQQKEVAELLSQAEKYFIEDQLVSPPSKNAADKYTEAMAIDQSNQAASIGLMKVALRLVEKGEASLEGNQVERAQAFAQAAIEVNPELDVAKALVARIEIKKAQLENVLAVLRRAETAENNQHYYHPRSGSAYSYYQQALEAEPTNKRATKGLNRVFKKFKNKAEAMIEAGEFLETQQMIIRAQKAASQNEQLPAFAAKTLRRIDNKLDSVTPAITRVSISDETVNVIDGKRVFIAPKQPRLYVGFIFKGFSPEHSVVQATLLNEDETQQITEVSVLISGVQGETRFTFDASADGFAGGRYVLYLRMNDNVLAKVLFDIAV